MFCKHCGKEIPEDARFCPYCQKTVEPTYMQRTEAFERSNQTKYMIFALGLVLLLVGFFMVTHSVSVTRYHTYYGIPVPYQATEYPLAPLGILLVIIGIVAIVAGFAYGSKQQSSSEKKADVVTMALITTVEHV
jgi:protein-S-isoprenylcysteine O-methyltransferase Ste14